MRVCNQICNLRFGHVKGTTLLPQLPARDTILLTCLLTLKKLWVILPPKPEQAFSSVF